MHAKFKKGLGQHFLVDKNIQRKIVEACELKISDIVLEIGGGRGELTGLIAGRVKKVYVLEIDKYLCEALKDNLESFSNVVIINQDILRFNLSGYFRRFKKKIKVVGNIPYYISSPIVEHLLNFRNKIDTIFITVQKEFAKRIVAQAGSKDWGSFSCFVQYYAQAKAIFQIKKTSFFPKPLVDSSFIRLKIRQKPCVVLKDERLFFKIIRSAFGKRRKALRNSLCNIVPPQKLERFFVKYCINSNIRPENLTLEDFANLANI